ILESTLALAPGQTDVQERLAQVLYQRVLGAELSQRRELVPELLARLRQYDPGEAWKRRLEAPAQVHLDAAPPGARVELQRLDEQGGRRVASPPRQLGTTPVDGLL